jgi:hypothetical protein
MMASAGTHVLQRQHGIDVTEQLLAVAPAYAPLTPREVERGCEASETPEAARSLPLPSSPPTVDDLKPWIGRRGLYIVCDKRGYWQCLIDESETQPGG